jgi:hypothetical protein
MTKFHKKGVWVIHIMQPGHETELKTEKIKFKTFHTNKKVDANLLIQELIARLCGRHFSELQNHYSHSYGQHDEEGMVIGLSNSEQNPMRTHLAELEYLIRDVDVERYNELFNNDELRAQLGREGQATPGAGAEDQGDGGEVRDSREAAEEPREEDPSQEQRC